jgi:hypothetical protein
VKFVSLVHTKDRWSFGRSHYNHAL